MDCNGGVYITGGGGGIGGDDDAVLRLWTINGLSTNRTLMYCLQIIMHFASEIL